MKKYFIAFFSVSTVLILSNCHTPKQTQTTTTPSQNTEVKQPVASVTYKTDVSAVIMSNCTPCHIPALGGKKTPFDNYASVKNDIDSIIIRVSKNPGERGFMPFKAAVKLSDANINVFKQWRDAGTPEQ